MKIGVFSVIKGGETAKFLAFARKRSVALSSGRHEIDWNVISLSPESYPGFVSREPCVPPPCLEGRPSMAHGTALNTVCRYADEYDITIVTDADFALGVKNWDEIVVRELKDGDVFGVEGLSSLQQKGCPCVFFVAFAKGVLTDALDFRPMEDSTPKGDWMDTGFRISEFIDKNGLKSVLVRGRLEAGSPTFASTYSYKNAFFGSHLGGMRHLIFDSPGLSARFRRLSRRI